MRKIKLVMLTMMALLLIVIPTIASAQKLVIWDYVPWRIEYYQKYADEYMKLRPDVEIEVQLIAQAEYVNKIVVGVITGTAPTMFSGHPSWVAEFNGMLEPFPHDLFPPDQLSQELLGYSQLLQDGNAYYYPLGMQGPMLFINVDHWEQAGIGAAPTTWKEAMDIGRRTTKASGGVTEVAGFFFQDDMMNDVFIDLNYQFGGKVYKGPTQVAFDEAPALDAVNLLYDMYQTGMSGFGETLSFQAGQHVMRYGFAWRRQQIAPVQELRWTVADLPTLTGEPHPGMSRMDYYFGMAVPQGHNPKLVREAFEFLHWAYANEERMMDLNSVSGTLPSQMSLWGLPEIVENPVLHQLTKTLPYAVVPGEYPQWIKNQLTAVRNAVMSGATDPTIVIRDVTRQINARLSEEPITWIAE